MPESNRPDHSLPPRRPFAGVSRLTVWLGAILAAFFALGPSPAGAGRGRGGGNKRNRAPKPRAPKPRAPQQPRGGQQIRGQQPPRAGWNPRSQQRSGVNPRGGQQRGTRGGQIRGGRRGTAWGNREEDRGLYRTWGLFLPDLGMGQGFGWGFPRDAAGNLLTVTGDGSPYPVPMGPDGTPLFKDPAGNPLPPTDAMGNPQWRTPTGQVLGLPADPGAIANGTITMSSKEGQTQAPQRRSLRRR